MIQWSAFISIQLRRHSQIVIFTYNFRFNTYSFSGYIKPWNFCPGTRGGDGDVIGEDYIHELFSNVVVHCIDIFANHCS